MMALEKKAIALFNLSPPYRMKANTMIMAAEMITSTILQVIVKEDEKEILVRDLVKEEENEHNGDTEETDGAEEETGQQKTTKEGQFTKRLDSTSFDEILGSCHTAIVPDSMFMEKSVVFDTEHFFEHGHPALQSFYRRGGNVVVLCIEGVFSVSGPLNELFGTKWQMRAVGPTVTVEPTEQGERLFGAFCPRAVDLNQNPHAVECDPINEGLFRFRLSTREEFEKEFRSEDEIFERLGIKEDKSMTCFDVEKSWELYENRYTNKFVAAWHKNNNSNNDSHGGGGGGGGSSSGHVVWWGDRGQEEVMAFCFCKILNLHVWMRYYSNDNPRDPYCDEDEDDRYEPLYPSSLTDILAKNVKQADWRMVLTSVGFVLLAVIIKLFQQEAR